MALVQPLNARDRRLAGILAVFGIALVLLGIPFGMETLVRSRASDNDELRQALADVQEARGRVRDRQAKKTAITDRYAKKAPALAGFLQDKAHAQKLEVSDAVDRPDVPHGKRYIERSTIIHLKKAGMLSIARFLESLEKSGSPVSVTRLNIRKRSVEPDSWDVEVAVSAFDRNEPAATPAAPSGSGKP
jgi:general secretion pathway protein M